MLYEDLSKVVPLDQQTLCLQLLEETEPSIRSVVWGSTPLPDNLPHTTPPTHTHSRYCTYQIGRKGTSPLPEAKLLALSDPQGKAGIDAIKVREGGVGIEAIKV